MLSGGILAALSLVWVLLLLLLLLLLLFLPRLSSSFFVHIVFVAVAVGVSVPSCHKNNKKHNAMRTTEIATAACRSKSACERDTRRERHAQRAQSKRLARERAAHTHAHMHMTMSIHNCQKNATHKRTTQNGKKKTKGQIYEFASKRRSESGATNQV